MRSKILGSFYQRVRHLACFKSPNSINAFVGRKGIGELSVLEFNVNNSYEVPASLIICDIHQFQASLDFAARLIDLQKSLSDEFVKTNVYEDLMKATENKHKEQLQAVEKAASENMVSKLSDIIQKITDQHIAHSSQIDTLRSDYDSRIEKLTKEKKKLEDNATAAKSEIEDPLAKEILRLKKQIAEKDIELQSLSKGESIIRKECDLEAQKLLKLVEDKNKEAQNALGKSCEDKIALKEEVFQQREAKLAQREQELQKAFQRNASSSYRGQDGEIYFQTLAEERMNWKLTDTSNILHSCDYRAIIHKINVFFEIKNHTSEIKTDQITKFLRDMKEHPDVQIGVFISLNTRITGKDKENPILIEWIDHSQCVVYIQAFKELDVNHTISLLDQIIKLSSTYNKMVGFKGDISEESMLQVRFEKAQVYIEQYITETAQLIKRVTNDQKLHRNLVESTYSHTLAVLKTQSHAIHTALEILTGKYIENNTIDETLVDVVEEVKAKKGGKKKVQT